jgi:tetratricopeptide (TPR) repeat protein
LSPDNSVALFNAVEAFSSAGRDADGCKLLEKHAGQLQSGKSQARYAELLALLKRDRDAIAAYSEAFAEGYRDDAAFADYLQALQRADQTPRALDEADAYLKISDSQAVAIEKAKLLAKAGRQDEAVALLDKRQPSIASSVTLNCAMIEAYREAGQYQKAMQLIDALVAQGHDSAQTWYVKHNVQCSLKRYEDAKASLEKALEKSPADLAYKQSLERLNIVLGQSHPEPPPREPFGLRAGGGQPLESQ